MSTVIVDYASGNLHSALKSFQRMADETGAGPVVVSADPEAVLAADRLVLPGVGAFAACRAGLAAIPGLYEAIEARVIGQGVPFLGICVGQQMMATLGREGRDTPGFGWIPGEVVRIAPADRGLKVPHMGWNALEIIAPHPVLAGIALGRALAEALGDKRGIRRYGSCHLAMDEALVRAALDLSGRPFLVWKVDFPSPTIGGFDVELVREFFTALAMNARMTLNVALLDGANSHHIAEAAFKSVAQALRAAVEADPRAEGAVPSTKGTLSG